MCIRDSVDIGVKQDGLVHVSEVAHKYIQDPAEVLKLNDKVKVKVLEVCLLYTSRCV